jgi:O-antigen ligase
MKRRLDSIGDRRAGLLEPLFAGFFGALLGLALLKFGNLPIMEKWVTAPTNTYEFVLGSPWPIGWGYGLLGAVAIIGLMVAKWELRPCLWLIALPLAWFTWACISAIWTVDPDSTRATLAHLFACVVCFYLGLVCLARVQRLAWFWSCLLCAFLIVILVGWEQHFGGLEQTRKYFFLYLYPRMKEVPPEYLKKLSSTRVFSTLFYPNALAGALLLLLPILLVFIWQARERFTLGARAFILIAIGIGALGCLYWSGSKGGWLLMLLLGLIWLLRLPFNPAVKRVLVAGILLAGLAGFFVKYAGFFQKGATSVGARFDYWEAALRTASTHPLFGTGPGTFSTAYQKVKRPESEMARLAHNDYLEQASDSGMPAFLLYSAFIVGALVLGFPPSGPTESPCDGVESQPKKDRHEERELSHGAIPDSWTLFALWLGVLGWALQGLVEFGLYLPSLAWPAFAFMGLLLGVSKAKAKG